MPRDRVLYTNGMRPESWPAPRCALRPTHAVEGVLPVSGFDDLPAGRSRGVAIC